jgi:alpha-L-rhamnosidase
MLELGSHEARLIRLTATKLSGEHDAVWDPAGARWRAGAQKSSYLALAEMEVLGNGRNLAHGKPVTASDVYGQECFNPPVDSLIAPCIHGGWSPDYLTDGRTEPGLGSRFRLAPVCSLRKEFVVEKTVRSATLYATALGSHEFGLNGHKIGDHRLAPPWTVSSKRVLYQTLDATAMLKPGANTLAAMLGDGCFRMRGWDYFGGNKQIAGFYNADERWLLEQLEVEYINGSRMTDATDRTWQTHGDGPFRYASMYDGVLHDERKGLPGWVKPGLTDLQG